MAASQPVSGEPVPPQRLADALLGPEGRRERWRPVGESLGSPALALNFSQLLILGEMPSWPVSEGAQGVRRVSCGLVSSLSHTLPVFPEDREYITYTSPGKQRLDPGGRRLPVCTDVLPVGGQD